MLRLLTRGCHATQPTKLAATLRWMVVHCKVRSPPRVQASKQLLSAHCHNSSYNTSLFVRVVGCWLSRNRSISEPHSLTTAHFGARSSIQYNASPRSAENRCVHPTIVANFSS